MYPPRNQGMLDENNKEKINPVLKIRKSNGFINTLTMIPVYSYGPVGVL